MYDGIIWSNKEIVSMPHNTEIYLLHICLVSSNLNIAKLIMQRKRFPSNAAHVSIYFYYKQN